jgi:hypothetical protein
VDSFNQSGNPTGCRPGIKDKRTARRLLEPHAEEFVAKVVEMAKAGYATAQRICTDRLMPPAKAATSRLCCPSAMGLCLWQRKAKPR